MESVAYFGNLALTDPTVAILWLVLSSLGLIGLGILLKFGKKAFIISWSSAFFVIFFLVTVTDPDIGDWGLFASFVTSIFMSIPNYIAYKILMPKWGYVLLSGIFINLLSALLAFTVIVIFGFSMLNVSIA